MPRRSPKARRAGTRRTIDRRVVAGLVAAFVLPIVSMLVLRLIAGTLPDALTGWSREATAALAVRGVGILGIPHTLVDGTDIRLTNHVLRIDFACTAFDWTFLFMVAVLVMPVARRYKLYALGTGLPVILLSNVVRLMVVAGVSEWIPQHFDVVHDVILQVAMAAIVGVMWVVFLWVSRDEWPEEWG